MLRLIAGVIVGFVVMAVIVMATFGITMAVLGLEGIIQPNSWWTSNAFNIIVLVGGLIAAIAGGMVCKAISRTTAATLVLVAIVLIMGTGSVVINTNKPDPPARIEAVTMEGIQKNGKEPHWFAIFKIVLAAAGLVIGSSLVAGRRSAT
jgi:hypothetical protein